MRVAAYLSIGFGKSRGFHLAKYMARATYGSSEITFISQVHGSHFTRAY